MPARNYIYLAPSYPSAPDFADDEPENPFAEEQEAEQDREDYAGWFGDGSREIHQKLIQYALKHAPKH